VPPDLSGKVPPDLSGKVPPDLSGKVPPSLVLGPGKVLVDLTSPGRVPGVTIVTQQAVTTSAQSE
jgi:hypothetical protein